MNCTILPLASMGPWLRSHGRRVFFPALVAVGLGFNGAVASQPRKGSGGSAWTTRARRLQWGRGFAATEGGGGTPDIHKLVLLQWGRGFAATEGQPTVVRFSMADAASMGPWLRSHGRLFLLRPLQQPAYRFNGAVASQPRKEVGGAVNLKNVSALQWGRGFAATEGRGRWPDGHRGHYASMGPWLRSHGRGGI